jgi:hypothetical protein
VLKGLCNWFFFFIFMFKIVSRDRRKWRKIPKKSTNRGEKREIERFGLRTCSTAHRAADIYYYFPATSE